MSSSAFAGAMASYCTDFYTSQRAAEEKYPAPDLQSQISYAQLTEAQAQRTEKELARLTPPTAMARAFSQFVANAHRISQVRAADVQALQTTGTTSSNNAAFDEAFSTRWSLATVLHASRCDGKLPPDQQATVIGAAREWETTKDLQTPCTTLATPWFPLTQFADQPDPLTACLRQREGETVEGLPTDITIQKVTGVDGLSATVYYSLVGGCACGTNATMRLFFINGKWLVAYVDW